MSETVEVNVGNTWTELVANGAATSADIGNATGAKLEVYISATTPNETEIGYPVRAFDVDKIPTYSGGIWGRLKDLDDGVTASVVVVTH